MTDTRHGVGIVEEIPHILAKHRQQALQRELAAKAMLAKPHRFGFETSVKARLIPIIGAGAGRIPGTAPHESYRD